LLAVRDVIRTLSVLDAISDTVVGTAQDRAASVAFTGQLRNGSCEDKCGLSDGGQDQDRLVKGRHL